MAKKKETPTVPMPLVGKGQEGNFVHETQTMAKEEGFGNVSRLWLDKCLTYQQVADKIQEGRAEIEDFRIPFKGMKPVIGDDGAFTFEHEGVRFKPTEFAFGHIAGQAGVSRMDVEILAGLRPDTNGNKRERPEDKQALMTMLQSGFSLIDPNKRFLFRTQKDGTLRAWLSNQYQIIDNIWFLDAMKDIIPGGMFSHWRGDGDLSTLWGNILIPDTIRQESDSEYGAMFSIGNSEIGRRRLHATPSLFRAICMNGCIWSQTRGQSFKQIHKGAINLDTLKNDLKKHLQAQIPLVNGVIDILLGTRNIGWDGAQARPVFAALGHYFRLSKADNTNILKAWRQQAEVEPEFNSDDNLRRSGFAVINAVTRSGKDSSDPSEWVKRDEMGGMLLDWRKDDWSHLFSRAKSMKPEEVVASFVNSHN